MASVSRRKPTLVIGIDFGTTYTGVSYGWAAAYDRDDDIITITDWPSIGSQTEHAAKAPTQIAYEPDETGVARNCWGYLIQPGVPRCVWMKLLLDKNARVTEYDDPSLLEALGKVESELPPAKTVQHIAIDFFKELYQFTMKTLYDQYSASVVDITPIKYWFTMPAIWSDEAQINTLQAAAKGGFGARKEDEVSVIPEPEAAALATLTESGNVHGDKIDMKGGKEVVLVCDCGGGTVDLTAYRLYNSDPWQLEEIAIGSGGKCGATNLDRNLRELLSHRFGEKFDSLGPSAINPGSQMMQDFEWNKQIFGKPGARLKSLRLFMNQDGSKYYDSLDGEIILDDEDMKKIFDPVVDRILTLIEGQVKRCRQSSKTKITYLLLVGGLGDSPYLRNRLNEWCIKKKIRMGGPGNSWGAVVRGAVVRGLQLATVARKKCRRHYGMELSIPYDPQNHGRREDWWRCPFTGDRYLSGYMVWSIERGTVFTAGGSKPIIFYNILSHGQRTLDIDVKSCSLDKAPEWFNEKDVEQTAKITADLSDIDYGQFAKKVIDGIVQYQVWITLELVLGHKQGTVGFQLKVDDQLVGQISLELETDKPKRKGNKN